MIGNIKWALLALLGIILAVVGAVAKIEYVERQRVNNKNALADANNAIEKAKASKQVRKDHAKLVKTLTDAELRAERDRLRRRAERRNK